GSLRQEKVRAERPERGPRSEGDLNGVEMKGAALRKQVGSKGACNGLDGTAPGAYESGRRKRKGKGGHEGEEKEAQGIGGNADRQEGFTSQSVRERATKQDSQHKAGEVCRKEAALHIRTEVKSFSEIGQQDADRAKEEGKQEQAQVASSSQ